MKKLIVLAVSALAALAAALPAEASASNCRTRDSGYSRVYAKHGGISCGRAYGVVVGFLSAGERDNPTADGSDMLFRRGFRTWTLGAWSCDVKVRYYGDDTYYTRWHCSNGYGDSFRWKYGYYGEHG